MFKDIFKYKILENNSIVNVFGLSKGVQASYVWNLFRASNKSILVVTNTLYEANSLYKSLESSNNEVLLFPMDDFLVSEAIAISPDLMAKRVEVLNEITKTSKNKIIITNLMGYLRFLPDKSLWDRLEITLKKDDEIKRDDLIKKLDLIGYKKDSLVTKTGEYANRGYILDIFPYNYDNPVRIEFFDDVIDSIREFDSNSQRSLNEVKSLKILPFTEFINEKGVSDIPEKQSMLPFVVNKISSLSEYLDDKITIFIDEDRLSLGYKKILEEEINLKKEEEYDIESYMHDFYNIKPVSYININETDNYIKSDSLFETYKSSDIDKFNGDFKRVNEYIEKMFSKNMYVILSSQNKNMINDFISKIKYNVLLTNANNLKENVVNIISDDFANGFVIDDKVILTENEIYKKQKVIKYKSKFRYGSKITDINKLEKGDYVVHASHGIAKYLGIVTLTVKNMKKDYLHLEYKDNDKLYVPVEKIEYISKYSSNEASVPRLNKLGGADWAKQKARIKGKVKDIAKELLNTSAKRKLVKGFAFLSDDEEQILFESKFPYDATKDQIKAIKDIKDDMMLPYPMDRLLCGDVGYGKTEVAFRAIFKAIKSGKQVAFLCPTTILSKQHYTNALSRFDGFGINTEVLNRFVSSKKKEEILKNIENGKIDLIIGTHRLLNSDIKYKDLGLLVIDEEQRFGVTHKEKIKSIKENIDVLTLSATPIPRTLQMSLTNIRGLSLIETPPAFRYPVQTYVLKENNEVIKDAIYKELSRDGQVFVLYNSVLKIEDKVNEIKRLVPEANVTYIHGRMNKDEIENTMEAFVNKDYNVLVCTTIIETGIDIENVNTLIVYDADHFGLSQLYQIRGRIGRGKNIAYAYLCYQKNKELNNIAVKRLDAIKEFTELGSGYALAVRDLSIRGAGDILGKEQSGFIDTVGYDLYLRILNEEVEKLKGNYVEEDEKDEMPLLKVTTHISDKYAKEEDLKIEIHKKINTINNYETFTKVKEELTDRFGSLDDDIINYMKEELFEVKAIEKKVIKVYQTDKEITVYFSKEVFKNIDGSKLLFSLFDINKNFDIKYINNILRITLPLRNLELPFLDYLLKMLDVIE